MGSWFGDELRADGMLRVVLSGFMELHGALQELDSWSHTLS